MRTASRSARSARPYETYETSGCVFGCEVRQLVHYVRGGGHRGVAEVMRTLHACLEPAGRALVTCHGDDAECLLAGFGSSFVLPQQVALLRSGRRGEEADTRIRASHGRSVAAIGVSTAVFVAMHVAADDASAGHALMYGWEPYFERCLRELDRWRPSSSVGMEHDHLTALRAERRAVQRGLLAGRVAVQSADALGLQVFDKVRLVLACMRRGMWPTGRRIDRSSQNELCEWIHTDAFLTEPEGAGASDHSMCARGTMLLSLPLSAISELPRSMPGDDAASECSSSASSCGSSASASSGYSTASSGGPREPLEDNLFDALERAFREE